MTHHEEVVLALPGAELSSDFSDLGGRGGTRRWLDVGEHDRVHQLTDALDEFERLGRDCVCRRELIAEQFGET
jgi:hypothetical protein